MCISVRPPGSSDRSRTHTTASATSSRRCARPPTTSRKVPPASRPSYKAPATTSCWRPTTPRCGWAPGRSSSAGVFSTQNGSFDLSEMESIVRYNLTDDRVPVRGNLAARWGWLAPNRRMAQPGVVAPVRRERRTRGPDVEGVDPSTDRRRDGARRRRGAGTAEGDGPGRRRRPHDQRPERAQRRHAPAVRPGRGDTQRGAAQGGPEPRRIRGRGAPPERELAGRAPRVGARRYRRRAASPPVVRTRRTNKPGGKRCRWRVR